MPALSQTPYLHQISIEKLWLKSNGTVCQKGLNPICFPPKTTTNSPINKLLHHTFKWMDFGERELSKREKKTVKHSWTQNSQTKPNLCSSLWIREHNILFCSLLTPEHLKAVAQVPNTHFRFKVSHYDFELFIQNIIKYVNIIVLILSISLHK